MKATTFLPVALAFTASAEMQLYGLPKPVKRDFASDVNAVCDKISAAMDQFGKSVNSLQASLDLVYQSEGTLVDTLKNATATISSSGAAQDADTAVAEKCVNTFAQNGQNIFNVLYSKRPTIASANLCESVYYIVQEVAEGFGGFFNATIKQLPADQQKLAAAMSASLSASLEINAVAFSRPQCMDYDLTSRSMDEEEDDGDVEDEAECSTTSEQGYPVSTPHESVVTTSSVAAQTGAVTVTVTAPCACESTTTVKSTSKSTVVITPTTTSVPYPTGGNSTTVTPTGSMTTTSASSIPTAGAAANGVGALGLMAGLAAALLV
ncbi:hydrophobic surface binding protein A-domain-containing protein [Nemania sp. FL0031]|nr:hydrophobic surface binding protein A-domain-containing protein [Nemania sp. FL0031]